MASIKELMALLNIEDKKELFKYRYLDLYGLKIKSISGIATLKNIEILSLSCNDISSLKSLQFLTSLTELYLRDNPFIIMLNENLNYLKKCTKLTILNVYNKNFDENENNRLEEIFWNYLPNLKVLNGKIRPKNYFSSATNDIKDDNVQKNDDKNGYQESIIKSILILSKELSLKQRKWLKNKI